MTNNKILYPFLAGVKFIKKVFYSTANLTSGIMFPFMAGLMFFALYCFMIFLEGEGWHIPTSALIIDFAIATIFILVSIHRGSKFYPIK